MRLHLEFSTRHGERECRRLSYAFRLFCAIYGHTPLLDRSETADACLSYNGGGRRADCNRVHLGDVYSARPPLSPAPPPRWFVADGERIPLIHRPDEAGRPDWLAEIFEWVSCADEYSVTARDDIGAIPFRASYVGRHRLDVRMPYAALAMRMLQRRLCCQACDVQEAPLAPQPMHFIVNTHDIDFIALSRWSSFKRLLKNAGNSLLASRMPRLASSQLSQALTVAMGGEDPLDQIEALRASEYQQGAGSTFMVVPVRRHRRDPNYDLDDPAVRRILDNIARTGAEIGVHGSYTSMDGEDRLSREFRRLRQAGFAPIGSRQHWLRFTVDRLITALEKAGAVYDTSLGWRDQIGFRAGACFAFPPYDFMRECAASFLEIPLVVMDQALLSDRDRCAAAMSLLDTSRRFGWGGVSVLWHPASFGGAQLPVDIGDVFWALLRERDRSSDTWISGASFVAAVQERYRAAGLPLREVPSDSNDIAPAPFARFLRQQGEGHGVSSTGSARQA